jgi:hypothetical protein
VMIVKMIEGLLGLMAFETLSRSANATSAMRNRLHLPPLKTRTQTVRRRCVSVNQLFSFLFQNLREKFSFSNSHSNQMTVLLKAVHNA